MNKLLELQLNVWKLTGTINRLQSVETRIHGRRYRADDGDHRVRGRQRAARRGRRTRADPTCGRTPGRIPPTRQIARATGAVWTRERGRDYDGGHGAAIGGRREPGSTAGVRL